MNHRVVIREVLHSQLVEHLLNHNKNTIFQEEVCLALWYPGDGSNFYTGILQRVFLPTSNRDRNLHGNVTVHGAFLNRVLDSAIKNKAGVAVLHSHPTCGWQSLSEDDDDTERNIILPFIRESGLPLLGLTLAKDATWSARFWFESRIGKVKLVQCTDVRRVGARSFCADSPPFAHSEYSRHDSLRRTIDSWGIQSQAKLARTHICVVGVGSVGSMVLESLARTGFEKITIIDDDVVATHNLDRLAYADRFSVGSIKVYLAKKYFRRIATASRTVIRALPLSIRCERAYRHAADADLIFSCVDNAEARDVLNHLAYSNCIPLIDGGVLVDSTTDDLFSAYWRVYLVGPDMQCLRCRKQYSSSQAADERAGLRHRGRYIDFDEPNGPEPGQNTFAFCNLVAAQEFRILLRYLLGKPWWHDTNPKTGLWAFEHQFIDAHTTLFQHPDSCVSSCEFTNKRLGTGKLGRPSYPFLPEPQFDWNKYTKRCIRLIFSLCQRLFFSLKTNIFKH